jgi:hypothetical protein
MKCCVKYFYPENNGFHADSTSGGYACTFIDTNRQLYSVGGSIDQHDVALVAAFKHRSVAGAFLLQMFTRLAPFSSDMNACTGALGSFVHHSVTVVSIFALYFGHVTTLRHAVA